MRDTAVQINDKKTIRSWAFFDWANSAYALVISTAVFPPYFSAITPDNINILGFSIPNSAVYSYSISLSFLIVAILAPMLSGVADHHGKRKFFLKFFTALGAFSCASLYFFNGPETIWLGLGGFMLATIGYGAGVVFYNSYLPIIATEDKFDKISAQGFAYGYIGSVILLIFILLMVSFPGYFGIVEDGQPARIGFLLVGVWWILFAQITFKKMPSDSKESLKLNMFKTGYHEIIQVGKNVLKSKNIKGFLYSYFFYIGAVNTIIYLATVFAEKELSFETSEMIMLILILQLVGIGGAYFFAWLSNKISNKASINAMLFIWIGICIGAYFTSEKSMFYVLSGCVGLVMGGIQSLSRSTYSKIIDEYKSEITSYFSFYDVTTRLAIVSSTFIFGYVEQLTGSIRNSVLSLIVFFLLGVIFLWRVDLEKPKSQ